MFPALGLKVSVFPEAPKDTCVLGWGLRRDTVEGRGPAGYGGDGPSTLSVQRPSPITLPTACLSWSF